MSGPVDALKQGLAELYKSGDFSDFTIACGPYILKVHKAVVCAQSGYFRAPCGKAFAEGKEGYIALKALGSDDDDESCDDPEAIKLMVNFFYHLDYRAETVELATESAQPSPTALPDDFSTDSDKDDEPLSNRYNKSEQLRLVPVIPQSAQGQSRLDRALEAQRRFNYLKVRNQALATIQPAQSQNLSNNGATWIPRSALRLPRTSRPANLGPGDPPLYTTLTGQSDSLPRGQKRCRTPSPRPELRSLVNKYIGSSDGNVVMHARVFAAAVKYQVPALQKLATSKFRRAAKTNWNHSTFAEAAHIVYTTTPEDVDDLRHVVCETIHQHRALLSKANMKAVLSSTPTLSYMLLCMAHEVPWSG